MQTWQELTRSAVLIPKTYLQSRHVVGVDSTKLKSWLCDFAQNIPVVRFDFRKCVYERLCYTRE